MNSPSVQLMIEMEPFGTFIVRLAIFFEAALIIAVLGFAGTVALAKFLMRGEVIE